MRPTDKIEKQIEKLSIKASAQLNAKVHHDIDTAANNTKVNIWRYFMQTRKNKLTFAATVIFVCIIGIALFSQLTKPAWAIDQTIEAMKSITTAVFHAEMGNLGEFNAQCKLDPDNLACPRIYAEIPQQIGMMEGEYFYWILRGVPEIYKYKMDDLPKGAAAELYKDISGKLPWLMKVAPTMFHAAKLLANDWHEEYELNEQTGRYNAIVTGSYKPLSTSFEVAFDVETKLAVRGKYWKNPNREGKPYINIDKVDYDVPVPDEVFDLEKRTGAVMVDEEGYKKRWELFVKCCQLFEEEDYSASIEAGMQLYQTYPDYWQTPEGLGVVGRCYEKFEDYDNAIKMFQKVIDEYEYPEYAPKDAWVFLAHVYKETGENAKAIQACETVLLLLEKRNAKEPGHYNEEYFQHFRDQIAELKDISP